MYDAGEKVHIFDTDAVILTSCEDEVLLYFEKGYIKWIEKALLQLMQTC